jgi:GTPase
MPPSTRAGFVTFAGRPNAGKSTLMNALIGEHLSIVTERAQTTWERVMGIRTEGSVQMVFLDTPGLLEVRDLHQRAMLAAAHQALAEADVVLLLIDATHDVDEMESPAVRAALAATRAPIVAAVNKIDAAGARRVALAADWCREQLGVEPLQLSALRGDDIDELLRVLEPYLPESPFLYPEDDLASQPVRFFVGELVREAVFEHFTQEVPYAVAARVEDFREAEDPVYIQVTLYVETNSHKRIVVGKGGSAIRALGIDARRRIETFLGRSVYLDLWVKHLDGWRRKRHHLSRLGYKVPDDPS